MDNHQDGKEPLIAQSRAGEAGANLTDVLERDQARDAFYKGADRGEPMHWRDVGPDELWNAAWEAATKSCKAEIDKWIKPGVLQGNGCNDTAQRNVMILASNLLAERIERSNAEVSGEPKRSFGESA